MRSSGVAWILHKNQTRVASTKTKQEWPDSGSTLENIFCNFYEINSSQDFFCIAKHFGVDGIARTRLSKTPHSVFPRVQLQMLNKGRPNPRPRPSLSSSHGARLFNFGAPRMLQKNASCTQWNTEKRKADVSSSAVFMRHQTQYFFGQLWLWLWPGRL